MKKLLATAAVAALVTPFAAFAESEDSLAIQMAATVEDVCTVAFDAAEANTIDGGAAGVTLGDDTVTLGLATTIGNSDDPLTDTIGDISDVQIILTANLFCNGDYGASLDFANGFFQENDIAGGGNLNNPTDFSDQLAYDVTVAFDTTGESENPALAATLDSTSGDQIDVAGSQHRGLITITINTGQDDVLTSGTTTRDPLKNLIAGLYTEAMTLSFVMDGLTPGISFDTDAPTPQSAL